MNTRLTIFALLWATAGCAGSSVPVTEIPVSADHHAEVAALAKQIENARSAKVDVLSPTWFKRASDSLARATQLSSKGGSVKEVLARVAEGRAQLEQAQRFSDVAAATLPKVIEARDAARNAGATAFGKEYDAVESRFLAATREIEDDDLSAARKQRDALARDYRALEIKAIKERTLGEVRERIAEAEKLGAREVASKALARAKTKLAETDKFIAANPYASQQMNKRAQDALFHANRAVALTEYAKATQKQTPEARALNEEESLAKIASALGMGDIRDQRIARQRSAITSQSAQLRKDRDFLVEQTTQLRAEKTRLAKELDETRAEAAQQLAELDSRKSKELAELSQTAEKLRQEKEFNETFERVSGYFSKDDAEVYKEGRQLLIRLRGINFPRGGYVIQPEDYGLLTKVQMAIRGFSNPTVVVEGHTDSTGSKGANQVLSERRAEAVRSYMIANNVLPESRIAAVGKADSEPLAPNTTKEGRALNRRIDVIVVPEAP